MLQILYNNKMLDVRQDLLVELSSTFFESDVLVGGFSYPIELPWTKHNQRMLGNNREVAVVLNVDGLLVKNCTLNFKRKENVCSGFLKFDLGELIADMKQDIRLLVDEKVVFDLGSGTISEAMQAYILREPSTVPAVFFPIKSQAFMEPTAELVEEFPWYENTGYLNMFRYGGFDVGLDTPSYQTVPQIYLVWLLNACFSKLGYQVKGEFVEDPEVRRWVLECNTAVNFGAESGINLYSFYVWKCLPSTSLVDLLKALREFEGVGCFVDAKLKTVELTRLVSEAESRDFVDLRGCELVNFEYGLTDSSGYLVNQFADEDDLNWKNKKYRKNFQIGAGGKEVNLKIGTVMMIKENRTFGVPGAQWLIPSSERPGNLLSADYSGSSSYTSDTNDRTMFKLTHEPSLRLLSYRGMQEDSEGELYPYATSVQNNISGDALGTRMLQFDGGTGQWYSSQEKYYGLLHRGNPLQIELLLPLGKVYELMQMKTKCLLVIDRQTKFLFPKRAQISFPSANGKVRMKGDFVELINTDVIPMPIVTPIMLVYVVVVLENEETEGAGGSGHFIKFADVVVKLYLDAELTQPADVADLTVYVKTVDSELGENIVAYNLSSAELKIETSIRVFEEEYDVEGNVQYQYMLTYSIFANENYYIG